jgi:hypothetical protein
MSTKSRYALTTALALLVIVIVTLDKMNMVIGIRMMVSGLGMVSLEQEGRKNDHLEDFLRI